MPHSSGGGSHGGGSHGGGSHGGGSRSRVSDHYFYGARRYRRHHRHGGHDEYVYSSSRPQKTSLSSVILIAVIGAVFLGAVGLGTRSEVPHKLNGLYDSPEVYDDADLIADDDALKETIKDYYVLTGICPVIYTVYDEDWSYTNPELTEVYEDLETYAYCRYVDNFRDEKHFVIVYSIPERDAGRLSSGEITVPDFKWEACQGDDTDPILTEGMFRRFANLVQDDLENGSDPGDAFITGFRFAISDAESKLNPASPQRILGAVRSLLPMLFVAGLIVPMLVITVRQYLRDRDVDYEEVPLDSSDVTPGTGGSGIQVSGYAGNSAGYHRSFSESTSNLTKAGSIFGLVFLIPFVVTGLIFIGAGIFSLAKMDTEVGIFILFFGIIWTLMSGGMLVAMLTGLAKVRKNAEAAPITAEYPKSEYPKAEYPDVSRQNTSEDPVSAFVPSQDAPSPFVALREQTGYGKSDIEEDDEDYRRMKRQGYE